MKNPLVTLVGLTGSKRSGKDTAARPDYLPGVRTERFAFATPLKEACKAAFGLTDEQVHGDLKETVDPRDGKTPRQLLQWFGTDVIREQFCRDHWLDMMRERITKVMLETAGHPVLIFVTDVRFDNEAELIRKLGGYNVKIAQDATGNDDPHASEAGISPGLVDFVLENHTWSLAYLHEKMDISPR